MTGTEVVVAIVIAVGIVGIVVPILPGTLLIAAAFVVWAFSIGGAAWWWLAALLTILVIGVVVQYAVPGKRLKDAGIPNRTLLFGALLGFGGFFVVPVVGLFIGFVLGVYVAEVSRVGSSEARTSTVHALKAVGLSIAIEATSAILATVVWIGAVIAT